MNNARKPLAGILALGVVLAMPMAFAQEAGDQQPAPAQQGQTTWSDLDTDGDGNLSRAEAAALPDLASVFDQADADGDGALTPDEYQAWAADQGQASPPEPEEEQF